MKILYLIKQKPDETLEKMIEEHKKVNNVTIVDLRENKNYEEIIDLADKSENIISW